MQYFLPLSVSNRISLNYEYLFASSRSHAGPQWTWSFFTYACIIYALPEWMNSGLHIWISYHYTFSFQGYNTTVYESLTIIHSHFKDTIPLFTLTFRIAHVLPLYSSIIYSYLVTFKQSTFSSFQNLAMVSRRPVSIKQEWRSQACGPRKRTLKCIARWWPMDLGFKIMFWHSGEQLWSKGSSSINIIFFWRNLAKMKPCVCLVYRTLHLTEKSM